MEESLKEKSKTVRDRDEELEAYVMRLEKVENMMKVEGEMLRERLASTEENCESRLAKVQKRLNANMEALINAQGASFAFRMLKQAISQLVKGSMGMCIEAWRQRIHAAHTAQSLFTSNEAAAQLKYATERVKELEGELCVASGEHILVLEENESLMSENRALRQTGVCRRELITSLEDKIEAILVEMEAVSKALHVETVRVGILENEAEQYRLDYCIAVLETENVKNTADTAASVIRQNALEFSKAVAEELNYRSSMLGSPSLSPSTRHGEMSLNLEEVARGEAIFNAMDADHGGSVDISELVKCLSGVLGSRDHVTMMSLLDRNGDNECSMSEWLEYLTSKKAQKGEQRFGYFLRFLEDALSKIAIENDVADANSDVTADVDADRANDGSEDDALKQVDWLAAEATWRSHVHNLEFELEDRDNKLEQLVLAGGVEREALLALQLREASWTNRELSRQFTEHVANSPDCKVQRVSDCTSSSDADDV